MSDIILIDKLCEIRPFICDINYFAKGLFVLKSVGASEISKLIGKSVMTVSLSTGK